MSQKNNRNQLPVELSFLASLLVNYRVLFTKIDYVSFQHQTFASSSEACQFEQHHIQFASSPVMISPPCLAALKSSCMRARRHLWERLVSGQGARRQVASLG